MRRLVTATLDLYRSAFADLSREVWLLAAATLVNRAGTMVLPFLTLYLTDELHFSASEAGLVMGAFGFGSMAGSWLGGWLSDRIDPVRVQVGSLLLGGLGFLVVTRLTTTLQVAIAVALLATVGDAFRPALFVSVARASRPATRPRAFALIRLAVNVGMAAGPAIAGFLAGRHYPWLFLGDAITCWLAAALLAATLLGRLTRPVAAPGQGGAAARGRNPWRDPPFLAFLALTVGMAAAFFQLLSTFPLQLRDGNGLPERAIGLLLASNALLVALFEMILLRSLEHLDRMRVAAVGATLVCLGMSVLPFGQGLGIAVLSMLLWTLGEMLCLPMTNAVVADRADDASVGRYMGAYTLAFSFSLVIAPIAGATVYDQIGPRALWFGIGALGIVLGLGFNALAPRFRADRPAE